MISPEEYIQFNPLDAVDPSMSQADRKALRKVFSALPESVLDFITSDTVTEQIITLGRSYSLQDSQIESLSIIIRDITIGKVFYGDMAMIVQEKLLIPIEQATALTQAIGQNLFSLIGKELQDIQKAKFSWRIEGKTQPPQAVATSTQQKRPNNSTISLRQQAPVLRQVLATPPEPQKDRAIQGNTINLRALKD